jgi:hypothetical protein
LKRDRKRARKYYEEHQEELKKWREAHFKPKKAKNCIDCGVDISARKAISKRCEVCQRKYEKEHDKEYYEERLKPKETRNCPDCGIDISMRTLRSARCEVCQKKHERKRQGEYRKKVQEKIKRYLEKYQEKKLKKSINFNPIHRDKALKRNYAMTLDDYDRMLNDQEGKCAICRVSQLTPRCFYVDHDHKTGKIRGLLCPKCNHALGCLEYINKYADQIGNYLEKNHPIENKSR